MLALISGRGRLPEILAEHLDHSGEPFSIFELAGFEADNPKGREISGFAIEQLGSFLDQLVQAGFTQVCFAGAIRRPPIDRTKIDAATRPLIERIQKAVGSGDDAALRVVAGLFAERGLEMRAAQDIAPSLLPTAGVETQAKPAPNHDVDIERAQNVIRACGALDLGQACVVSGGQVLAIEALPGTNFMLQSLAKTGPRSAIMLPKGGVLYKDMKPDQDHRFDMPTIGVKSVEMAHAAGLEGIVIGAGQVLVLDFPEVIDACNDTGLFLWVRATD